MGLTRINNQALTNVTSAGLPSGTIIQVKQATLNSQVAISTASTFEDIMSVSITPTSSSNKILVHFSAGVMAHSANEVGLRLLRDSTTIVQRARHAYSAAGGWEGLGGDLKHLDSPSTTSSITYKVQGRKAAGSIEFCSAGSITDVNHGALIVMEIAG